MDTWVAGDGIVSKRIPGASVLRADRWFVQFLAMPTALQGLAWLILILGVKAHALIEPPVWDSAMGIFPAAIYLAETGFDVQNLVGEPNWWEGGPNVHAFSLFTWFVAGVLRITAQPDHAFLLIHATTFLLVAWSLTLFVRVLAKETNDGAVAVAAGLFVLATPLVLVQVGAMYTETWVMAFSIAAWSCWREGRLAWASLFCVVALLVKLTGIAVFACVAVLLLVSRRPSMRLRLGLLGAMGAVLILSVRLPLLLGAAPHSGPRWGGPQSLLKALNERLVAIPDVSLLVGLSLIGAGVHCFRRIAAARSSDADPGLDAEAGARWISVGMPVLFCLGIVSSVFSQTIFLPRYLVPAVPFAVATILTVWGPRIPRPYLLGGLALASSVQAANFDGRLYPEARDLFSIVERSHAYRDLHKSQIDLIDALERMPRNVPIYVSRDVDYMLSSPRMGYVQSKIENTVAIYLPPHVKQPLARFPDEFMLAHSTRSFGGKDMMRLAKEALDDPSREVRQQSFRNGEFASSLIWIRKVRTGSESSRKTDPAGRAG